MVATGRPRHVLPEGGRGAGPREMSPGSVAGRPDEGIGPGGGVLVRANAGPYGVDAAVFRETDLHVHVQLAAEPKHGPSAGVVLVAAPVSSFTGRPLRGDLAMTGEITLSGHVPPVGGVKEKVVGACRRGLTHVVLPRQNEPHFEQAVRNESPTPHHGALRTSGRRRVGPGPAPCRGAGRPPDRVFFAAGAAAVVVRSSRESPWPCSSWCRRLDQREACAAEQAIARKSVFALGWRPIGSSKRRWQLQDCADEAEAARFVAGLTRFDGGGRWRVYDMVAVSSEAGSVKLVRRHLVAESVVRPRVRVIRLPGPSVAVDR